VRYAIAGQTHRQTRSYHSTLLPQHLQRQSKNCQRLYDRSSGLTKLTKVLNYSVVTVTERDANTSVFSESVRHRNRGFSAVPDGFLVCCNLPVYMQAERRFVRVDDQRSGTTSSRVVQLDAMHAAQPVLLHVHLRLQAVSARQPQRSRHRHRPIPRHLRTRQPRTVRRRARLAFLGYVGLRCVCVC